MSARAECLMLNKGPYLLEAIDQLHMLGRETALHASGTPADLEIWLPRKIA
jgi:hypothetical protein